MFHVQYSLRDILKPVLGQVFWPRINASLKNIMVESLLEVV